MSQYDPETRTWSGPRQPPIFNPAASVGQVIVNILERTPDKIFEISADTEVSVTRDELRSRMIRAALNLSSKFGLVKGDMVCMVADNSPCVTPVLFGCFLVGAPVHTLDASFEESDLVHLMGITRPKLVFCNAHNVKRVESSLKIASLEARIILLNDPSTEVLFAPVDNEASYRPPFLGDSDKTVALIVCSSGTTSFPKAICLTHAQLIAPYPRVSNLLGETALSFSSLYWISAVQMLMTVLFNGGTRITTTKPFSPEYACELINKYRVMHVFTPPSMLADMLHYCEARRLRLPSLRIVGCGGSPLPETLRTRANALLAPQGRVFVGYGMSEVGAIVSVDLLGIPNSAGLLMANVSARIANDQGKLLGPHEEGEIQLRYVHPFAGYYGNERETCALLTSDGFIQSGDIGYMDARGFLFVTDRKKEMLRYRGYQIAPAQLEGILAEHPAVLQATVVGLPDPEPPHVDLATALVVTQSGTEVTEDQILSFVNGKVPDYKRLRGGVFFVDSIPRTANGKASRRECRKLAQKLAGLRD
ncbi:probable 4-coumarate--CoA ligase 1 [Culex quinquefasciatus]|uniref:probable 4-coumarate--CoA ligase 1 n=1 Tax=Culex quinquefasciatus TaxID=7176 RepID=UPI0018E3BAEB|nr:probable 4-coumarate--CoA ligase 1 [Culex quinquefasciatus]